MSGFGGSSSGGGGQDIVQRTKSASNKRNTQQDDSSNDGGNDGNNQSASQTYVAPKPVTPITTGVANVAPSEASAGGGTFGTSFFSNKPTDINQKQFVAGIGEGATKDDLVSGILGGEGGIYDGASPFATKGVDRNVMTNMGLDAGVVPTDASVEAQPFAPAISGGDPGVGLQGFGAKMMGGEGQVIGADGVPSEFEALPTDVANSDVINPDAQMALPGQANISDQAYNIPTGSGGNGFYPNSTKAYQYQTNPFAGRMMNARSGFGRSLFS